MPRIAPLLLALILVSLLNLTLSQTFITVQPGDTLWDIAIRYDTTVDAIKQANALTSDALKPDTKLELPSSSNMQPETYIVKAGDTLYDISVAFNIHVDKLIAINNIDGSIIKPGQELILSSTVVPEPLVITIKSGDTLWDLAREHDVTVEELKTLNALTTDTLKPDSNLIVPRRFAGTTNSDQGGAATVTVEVLRGDTLWDIARKYNTSITALMSANELNSQTIKAGQTLKIVPSNEVFRASPVPAPKPSLNATMVWPLEGQITSRFGYRRLRIGGSNFHTGLDIDGETGDPIYAATSGLVTFSGWNGGYGNLVIISSGDTEYYYAHASELVVSEGMVVEAGSVIALVGSTGRSTGSHLHFEIRVGGQAIDPLAVLEQSASH